MSFWTNYILLKEKHGKNRSDILQKIEDKFGTTKRQELEEELNRRG